VRSQSGNEHSRCRGLPVRAGDKDDGANGANGVIEQFRIDDAGDPPRNSRTASSGAGERPNEPADDDREAQAHPGLLEVVAQRLRARGVTQLRHRL
jgi:hypothetical protein